MSEIKLNIEDKYLRAFLDFLQTLNYVSVKEVSGQSQQPNGAQATDSPLQNLEPGDPLQKAIRPMRKGLTVEDLIREQGFQGTDMKRLEQLAKELDIQEPIEDLLAQLTA